MSAAPITGPRPPTASMFEDLIAAQKAMPELQRCAINPHFHNRYVPLEEIVTTVVEILNQHNFVLTQLPTTIEDKPALTTTLLHASGEKLETTMLLLCGTDNPQSQGAAITYARRYSLMAMLGLAADRDMDGNRPAPPAKTTQRATAPRQSAPAARPPVCKTHGEAMRFDNKAKPPVWKCIDDTCTATVGVEQWRQHLANEKKPAANAPASNGTGPMCTQPQSQKLHILLGKYETNDVRLALIDQQFPALKPGEDGKRHTSGLTKADASKAIELLQRMEGATQEAPAAATGGAA